jgi:hypothetical protein
MSHLARQVRPEHRRGTPSHLPVGRHAGDANLHAYVGNSPTNWTDPTGLIYMLKPRDPCDSGSAKPPWWKQILCNPYFQDAIIIIASARGGRGPAARAGARARPSGTRPGARPSSGSGSRQPSSNQAANKQAHDAAREAGLNREQQRKLHDAISGEGIESYADILKIAKAIKAGNWH